MGNDLSVSIELRADTAQFSSQMQGAAQSIGPGLRAASQQGAQGLSALDAAIAALTDDEVKYIQSLANEAAQIGKTRGERAAYIAQTKGMSQAAQDLAKAVGDKAEEFKRAEEATDKLGRGVQGLTSYMVRLAGGTGAGGATRALGLIAPAAGVAGLAIGAVAAAAGALALAYKQGAAEADEYRKALVMTGNAAGTTVGQLGDMARAISQSTGTQGAAAAALAQMAGSGRVAADNLQAFTQVALGLERSVGVPVQQTVRELAELSKAPLAASVKLNEQYHYLTSAVYDQIKALEEQGRKDEAAALAQRTYATEIGRRKDEIVQNLGYMERAWNSVTDAVKGTWDAIRGIGRASTDVERLKAISGELAKLSAAKAKSDAGGLWNTITGAGRVGSTAYAEVADRIKSLQAEAQALYDNAGAAQKNADAQAALSAATQARADQDKIIAQGASKTVQMSRAMADAAENYRTQLAAIAINQAQGINQDKELAAAQQQLATALSTVQAQYAERKKQAKSDQGQSELANLKAQLAAAQLYGKQLQELGAAASKLNSGERDSLKLGEQIKITTDAKTLSRLREAQATADALGLQQRANSEAEKTINEHQRLIDTTARDAKNLDERAAAQERANEVFGLGRAAIEQMTLAEYERQAAEARASGADAQYIAELGAKIAAQKRWIASLGVADYKSAEQHADELLRNAQELNRAYGDEAQLSGQTGVEREKIAAQTKIQLKYAKELAAIDAKNLSDVEKQALRDKLLQARSLEMAAATAKIEQQYFDKTVDEIGNALTDVLMRAFDFGKDSAKNFLDSLKSMFNSLVLRPTVSLIVKNGVNSVVSMLTGGGNGNGGGGNGSNLLGLGKNAYSVYNSLGGSMSLPNVVGTVYANNMAGLFYEGNTLDAFLASNGAFGTAPAGAAPAGAASSLLSSAGAAVAGAAVGYLGGSALSNGFSAIGNNANTTVAAGTAIGATIGSIFPVIGTSIGALAGGLIGGLVNRLFGHKLTDTGIEGDFGGDAGFTGQSYQKYSGGWFSSSYTQHGALDAEVQQGLAAQFDSMRAGAAGMASVLGLGTDVIESFSAHIKLSLKGLSDEDATTKINEEFDKIAESLAAATLGTDAYTHSGETALSTLTRLSGSLAAVNTAFDTLNLSLMQSSLAGGDLADRLLTAFGGADNFNSTTSNYWQNYYSDGERVATITRQLTAQLASLGLEMPKTREGFRLLVEAQDLMTDSGLSTFAALMNIEGAFAQITPAAADAAAALEQLRAAFVKNYYSQDEQTALIRAQLADQFSQLGLDMPGTREAFRALVEAQDQTTEAGLAAYTALLQMQDAFAQITPAAQAAADAVKAATDAAWASMQQAIQSARDAAQAELDLRQERVDAAQAVVDLTRDQARELRGLVDGTAALSAAQANTWIDNALKAARATGYLPDAEGLSDAITAARAGMQTSNYSSRQDYEAAQLILANKLEALGDTGDAQLGTDQLLLEQAKNEVDRLDLLLKAGRDALDEARGNTVAVKDVASAVRDFYAALFAETGEQQSATGTGTTGAAGVASFGGGYGASSASSAATWDEANNRLITSTGYIDYNTGIQYYNDGGSAPIVSGNAVDAEAQTQFLLNLWKAQALEPDKAKASDMARIFGTTYIPAYADGGLHSGGVRMVGERGPEMEITGPARYFSAERTRQLLGGGADVVAAIQALQGQGYDIGRALIVLLQSVEQMARKQDAIGVLQREAA